MPLLFAIATILPLVPMALGYATGGLWVLAAVLSMTVLVAGLDGLVRVVTPALPEEVEFPAGPLLSVVLGLAQIALLIVAVARLGGGTLSWTESVGLAYATALWLGQVGNSNAHELIHRGRASLRRLGTALFVSVLYGHHASAHPKVHHTYVATPNDPATARLGQSAYAYFGQAWWGGFRAGRAAEHRLLEKRYGAAWRRHDPYIAYVWGMLACLAIAVVAGGVAGLLWYLALAGMATLQIMLSDYVQHYGLLRAEVAPGRYEPVGPAHSWNAPHWYSGAMMLHAPRHSDHHAHPSRPFHHLSMPQASEAPRLPRSLPTMCAIALVPSLWRRMMDHRARRWSEAAGVQAGAVAG
ncbi:Alkane 1-monooxygenase 1 [Rhodobacteraceae bacterium THAF1]|uniref:alkane 1-monooxygenase n=1 Tax=Palleronia sp. THAF1 TaxID=2587842 RepID=UPI000F3C0DB3|nr:alkane 1-monooxygenase [Palleronia sp. THAF1]QFU07468.1 Alkane 1-monooxygenase 1 [Palleronia sp. THAF1]VDC20620.1 Alkane 1-monooxygenase 1 [Rhodobacteraceae bacterium THAF1]